MPLKDFTNSSIHLFILLFLFNLFVFGILYIHWGIIGLLLLILSFLTGVNSLFM